MSASGPIGAATDFWRLRIQRFDRMDPADFEWREDILYRKPPTAWVDEQDCYGIEAVNVDDPDDVTRIEECDSQDEAHGRLAELQEHLDAMTASEFRKRYMLSEAADRPASD